MKLKLLLFINSLLQVTGFCQSNSVKSIDSLMKAANEIGVFNGNILISKKGKTIYQSEIGYADFTKSRLLKRESSMPIGSIAKEFNSTAILFLKEKGKLNLEDKVSDYLTYLPAWGSKIQIKHLLQYTSGLPRIVKNTDAEYIAELNKIEKLEFAPGTGYIYSNVNIFLQQEIIKKITNLSYSDFYRKFFFKVLRISGGEMPKDTMLIPNMAGSFDNDYTETTFIHGGGEMYFTVNDLYNWVKGLHEQKLINKNSLQILAQHFDKNTESSLGDVIFENGEILEHVHHGSGNNYESFITYQSKDDLIIILMTNNQNFKLGALSESIINILNNRSYTVPKKSIYLDIRGKLEANFEQGISFYEKIKSLQQNKYDFTNEGPDLISTGNYLMRRNRFEDAIKIFQLSTLADLENTNHLSNAYTAIGECYLRNGSTDMAILYCKKALELDPTNKTAENMLNRITIPTK